LVLLLFSLPVGGILDAVCDCCTPVGLSRTHCRKVPEKCWPRAAKLFDCSCSYR
jgi:hypothetical protein